MNVILKKMHEVAASPRAQMDKYLAEGKKIVLCAPVYTPEEIIHSMGFVPMGAWGGDMELNRAKEYCPAFLCAIVQSLLELGITGAFEGASAIVIPSLCDTLKTVGENWKYAVPSIPFIPMTYPQNRKPAYGVAYTKAGYERVIRDLEKLGGTFSTMRATAMGQARHKRECGFTYDVGQTMAGSVTISVPVFNHAGEIQAAIALSGLSRSLEPELACLVDGKPATASAQDMVQLVQTAGREVSRGLGYSGDYLGLSS